MFQGFNTVTPQPSKSPAFRVASSAPAGACDGGNLRVKLSDRPAGSSPAGSDLGEDAGGIAGEIWVVHAFQKKSKQGIKTPKREIDLIKDRLQRLKEILR